MANHETVDVCVIGGGASGLVAAKELTEAGMTVCVLERGPWYKREDFALGDELVYKRRNFFWPTVELEPRTWRPDAQSPTEFLSNKTQTFSNAMCVGGGTIHYSGLSWRFHESDFRVKSEDGPVAGTTIEDWPISYDDMEPFYEKAEWTVGVSGKGWSSPFDPPRKRDYPVGPAARNSPGAALEKGARKLGLHPFPTPLAILTGDYDGRPGCIGKGMCSSYGCPVGAKSSTLESMLPKALATGRLEIRPLCLAREITLDRDGKASGVTYFNGEGEEEHQAGPTGGDGGRGRGDGAAAAPVRIRALPPGVGQPQRPGGPEPHAAFSGGDPGGDVSRAAGRPQGNLQHPGAPTTSTGRTRNAASSAAASCTPAPTAAIPSSWRSGPSTASAGARSTRIPCARPGATTCTATAPARAFPVESNAVDLDPEVTDCYGLPVARITHTSHENDVRLATYLGERSREIYEAAGATRIIVPKPETRKLHNHQMGTCRMGDDPESSVVEQVVPLP